MTNQPSLFDAPEPAREAGREPAAPPPPDQAARDFAVDPSQDVVLEASAGTGKTRVLVERYVRLIEAGVDPRHVLAITFTRKAAAEMRERVLAALRERARLRLIDADRWRRLRDRVADIQISTIDAFCFGLLREFPLEADVDPAFQIADETEIARFASEALDLTLRDVRGLIGTNEAVRLLVARVKAPVLRDAVATLLDRRQVSVPAVAAFVGRRPGAGSSAGIAGAFAARLRDLAAGTPEFRVVLDDGPVLSAEFRRLAADLRALDDGDPNPVEAARLRHRLERYFLTSNGTPRRRVTGALGKAFETRDAKRRHEDALQVVSPLVVDAVGRLEADVNALLARGLLQVLVMAVRRYEQLLEDHALLDFSAMLDRAVALLARQEEFARSRLKLQARYHHLLVDEFQDTSRQQWRLIELLIAAWGEGEGAADAPTSIFVVGDRKQSIYRFRHAEAALLDEAAARISALRGGRDVTRAITASFRAVPELLAFVNALAASLQHDSPADGGFRFRPEDRFSVGSHDRGRRDGQPVVGLAVGESMEDTAAVVAAEIERLLAGVKIRSRSGGLRDARADDIAILFRARAGHQAFEEALHARGIRTYVYKGLGFFDAPEVQDLQALLRYLARPDSQLRAAELLRSRFIRLSDPALAALAPDFAGALASDAGDPRLAGAGLADLDRAVLARAREDVRRWRAEVDRITPGDLVDRVLSSSAYAAELAGSRLDQARENLKKVRALIRRVESRGYATIGRIADYFETLRAGEESNAIVAAGGAVSLMTIHAAKGLEFPIVFVVNLHVPGRARGGGISVVEQGPLGEPDVSFGSSEATDLEEQRDTEELKRLLYVAVTRARDRLFFAAPLPHGQLRRTARSFAGLLPAGLAEALVAAAAPGATTVEWASGEGTFDLAVCAPAPDAASAPAPATAAEAPAATVRRLELAEPEPATVTALIELDAPVRQTGLRTPEPASAVSPERLVGRLVHRLLQVGADPAAGDDRLLGLAEGLVRPGEAPATVMEPSIARHAVTRLRRILEDPDLAALFRGPGRRDFEVPFSYRRPGDARLVHGVIDCLVTDESGSLTVVEVKTGSPHPGHDRQAEWYRDAVSAAFGGAPVAVKIVYS
jgi:ATP-dependent helicase/nuclease subunit A